VETAVPEALSDLDPAPERTVILGVDVGGTFTDAVIVTGEGIFTSKVQTTPGDQSDGVMRAIADVLERSGTAAGEVEFFAHGMTVATNAVLEMKVARTALIATRGFTDLIEIGRQQRPLLYDLRAKRPPAIAPPELRIPAPERAVPAGILEPLEPGEAEAIADQVRSLGVEAVAVCLLHSDRHPAHERSMGDALARVCGDDVHVSLSNEVTGTFREYERASTTEIDASLGPLMRGYLERLADRCREAGLPEPAVMQSSGGLTTSAEAAAHPARTLLSGPAGGAAAASRIAAQAGIPDLVCLDMGGTSCDVCVIEGGTIRETGGREVAGRPVALPMVDIETVGAGGGSIAWRDEGGALRVGPQSAGARPGPACYGRGGMAPTVTDANLVLGRIAAGRKLSGVELDESLATRAIEGLADLLSMDVEECAKGILEVADAEMTRAVRVMTVERGIDPSGFSLLAFGGAGPLHGCSIAEALGMARVIIPRDGGVLSAVGLATAQRRRDEVRTVMLDGSELTPERLADLRGDADEVGWDLRYRGQSFELTVTCESNAPYSLREAFETTHEERYGFTEPGAGIELVTVRRRFTEPGPKTTPPVAERLSVAGPASIDFEVATAWVPGGWTASDRGDGFVSIERNDLSGQRDARHTS
jgi:N-methylhydantoinase A/oxoprolinase/acetone carboxylase beta subunit